MVKKKVRQLLRGMPQAEDIMLIPGLALRSVTSKSGAGVYASSDTLYKGAIFGRDSLEVAEDLMQIKPRLVRNILMTLASLQGQTQNDKNEEEPGKIVHEYRSVIVDGKLIDDTSMNIFRTLSHKWGGNDTEMLYYGSVDATPQFLRAIRAYTQIYGETFLDVLVELRDGTTVTMRQIVVNSANWLMQKYSTSRSGLIEYQSVNPHGIANQVWKDSQEFYVHENKQLANHEHPIASIEVQGLAYDGLLAAAQINPTERAEYMVAANAIRDKTFELLWQEDRGSFALGLDFDDDGAMRILRTSVANPAALLDTAFFDNIESGQRQKYITSLVEHVLSDDFLTDAGIRSRALSAAHLVDHWDYHGSYVSWPKETYDVAKGLRRQGFEQLARQLENRLLNVSLKHRRYPEFVYVDPRGRVLAGAPSSHSHGEIMLVDGTNQPERVQAWTVSAIVAIISMRLKNKVSKNKPQKQEAWQRELEQNILSRIPSVNRYLNPFALSARYPSYKYKLTKKL